LRVADGEFEIGEAFGGGGAPGALENRRREIQTANPANVARETQRECAGSAREIKGEVRWAGFTIRARRSASATRLATA
jgi:hypothetical protein